MLLPHQNPLINPSFFFIIYHLVSGLEIFYISENFAEPSKYRGVLFYLTPKNHYWYWQKHKPEKGVILLSFLDRNRGDTFKTTKDPEGLNKPTGVWYTIDQ